MTELAVISPSQASRSQTERVAREWIVQFAELYSVNLADRGPRFVELWVSALVDLRPEALEAACRKAMQVCKFFPVPAEVRGLIEKAQAGAFELKAEEAWRKALRFSTELWHPDTGVMRFRDPRSGEYRQPELPPAIREALSAAGGCAYLFNCSREELPWARKRFIERFTTIHETSKVQHLLDGESKRVFADILRAATPKLLATAPSAEPAPNPPSRADVRDVLNRVSKPTHEELLAKLRRVQEEMAQVDSIGQAAAHDYMRKHGIAVAPSATSPTEVPAL